MTSSATPNRYRKNTSRYWTFSLFQGHNVMNGLPNFINSAPHRSPPHNKKSLLMLTAAYLVSLCFFIYLVPQFPHGLFPSHFVFRARQRSQLAQSAMDPSFFSSLESSSPMVEILWMWMLCGCFYRLDC
jgi:hypothetical protein